MKNPTLLTLSAIALSVISASAATVTLPGSNGTYGDTDAFVIDFDATPGLAADWTPDLSTSTTYSIDSVSVWENSNNTAEFYLAVYTGYNGGNNSLSGFQGVSTNTIDFSDATGTNKVTWNFTGITVAPKEDAGAGVDQRYFVLQTTASMLNTLVDLGDNTTGILRDSGSYSNYLGQIIKADKVGGFSGRSPSYEATLTAIPEPSSTALLGLGGIALILRRRR